MTRTKTILLAAGLSWSALGCASAQTGPEVAEYGTSRTDAERAPERPEVPEGREFWTKMR